MSKKNPDPEIRLLLGYNSTEELAQIILALKNTPIRIVDVAATGPELAHRAARLEVDAVIFNSDMPDIWQDPIQDTLHRMQDSAGDGIPLLEIHPNVFLEPALTREMVKLIHTMRKVTRLQRKVADLLREVQPLTLLHSSPEGA